MDHELYMRHLKMYLPSQTYDEYHLHIIYIRGAPFEQSGPLNPTPELTI